MRVLLGANAMQKYLETDISSDIPDADSTISPSSQITKPKRGGGQLNVHSRSTRPSRLIQTGNLFIYLPLDYQPDSTLFCKPSL